MNDYIPIGDEYRYHAIYHTQSGSTRAVLSHQPEGLASYHAVEVISVRGRLKRNVLEALLKQEIARIENIGRSD